MKKPNKKLYIPLHLLKKYSDENKGLFQESLEIDRLIMDLPKTTYGLLSSDYKMVDDFIRLTFKFNDGTYYHDISMEQYKDVVYLNFLLEKVDDKDLKQ